MNTIRFVFVFTASLVLGIASLSAQSTLPTTVAPLAAPRARISPHETISTVIGERSTGNRITLVYGRPYTKDSKTGAPRKIWGGLVAWNKADRLGADEATLLLTQKPLSIAGTTLPAGAYTLYIVPSETGATKLAFSSNLGKWGVPVDETKDVARFELTKASLEKPVDQLTIAVEGDTATSGAIKIQWENTQYSLPFAVAK